MLDSCDFAARRVTQRDVAAAAGLHPTTVSLALRGSFGISPVTRERVRLIASSMGFVPDPVISAFVAHRERISKRGERETNAFVTFGTKGGAGERCLAGVCARATKVGSRVDHLVAGNTDRGLRRLGQILYHRRIEGVILYLGNDYMREWCSLVREHLTVVVVGSVDDWLPFHRVEINRVGAVRSALHHARQKGWRRIGLVATSAGDERSMRALAASESGTVRDGIDGTSTHRIASAAGRLGVPVCEAEAARLARWLRAYQPEVLVAVARSLQPYLRAVGLCVPKDVALLDLDRDESDPLLPGVVNDYRAVGSVAFDVLQRIQRQRARDVPPVVTRTLVDGTGCPAIAL